MARYIDADELIKKIYPMGMGDGMYVINAKAVKFAIDKTPTADVVPKSEVLTMQKEQLEKLKEVRFEVERLQKAFDTYEETSGLKQAKAEVAREIFEEIERTCVDTFGNFYMGATRGAFAELKKKYTEGEA